MEIIEHLQIGFATAATFSNVLLLPRRRRPGHRDRRPAGPRAGRHHRDAAAGHVRALAGLLADHAGRHLLRRPVRGLDHRHPGQPAGGILVGRDGPRRLPDGQAGPCRQGTRHRCARVLLRRHRRHAPDHAVLAAAGGDRAQVRAAGIFLADGARPRRLDRARVRSAAACARHGGDRAPARHRRHRRQFRYRTLQLRDDAAGRRHQLRGRRHGGVRARRDHRQSGERNHAQP